MKLTEQSAPNRFGLGHAVGLAGVFSLLALFAWSNWPQISRAWLPRVEVAGLNFETILPGTYELTILVPNSFTRQYFTKRVTLDRPFQIARTEITINQWNQCFAQGGCSHKARQRRYQKGDHPVTHVSWLDAQDYTKWLSAVTGDTYRLPTEEEWGYVAFSGEDFTRARIDQLISDRLEISTTPLGRFRKVRSVGANGQNEWGIYDLFGSVWEWTLSCRFPSDEESRIPRSLDQLRKIDFCPNRIVQGDERAHVPYFVNEVLTGGCGTGAPVDNIGFRVLREL